MIDVLLREETLLNVVRSVTRNGRSILVTAMLALILVYFFSIVGFIFFKEDFLLETEPVAVITGMLNLQCLSKIVPTQPYVLSRLWLYECIYICIGPCHCCGRHRRKREKIIVFLNVSHIYQQAVELQNIPNDKIRCAKLYNDINIKSRGGGGVVMGTVPFIRGTLFKRLWILFYINLFP